MINCGYRTGHITDPNRSNWQNSGARPIAWSAWYPTQDQQGDRARPKGYFAAGDALLDAALPDKGAFPVVLLSHGTGGTAESLGWLARALARKGNVVLAPNHHGNTGLEPYTPEGFLCWWERAADLTHLLTALNASGPFADRLDTERTRAVGFSLGSHAVLGLGGAITDMARFQNWGRDYPQFFNGPKEFPDLAGHVTRLMETSEAFQQSWARQGNDYSDPRIKRAALIAPAPTIRAFDTASIRATQFPLMILSAGADLEAPKALCGDWLDAAHGRAAHHALGEHTGHYTFLEFPSDLSLVGQSAIFTDHPSVDRASIHQRSIELVIAALK